MKLPNASRLIVEREKVTDYLLNPAHRYGASKARFFTHFGFHLAAWEQLAQALREHGQKHDVTKRGRRVSARATRWRANWIVPMAAIRVCGAGGNWIKAQLRRAC
jgi:hypothetical protein